ncbi:hypothetical protein [Henriciella marina]|uniref:Uncharacterized protein n=1 Tax=Henriciella marina TaxID=453851 RepID=A0ABT4LWZ4_9PROT|nr:hypothetical protein [Henriciella marina]MCZ4298658.1 hypothetical protein [Henriciella marina]
MGKSQLDKFKEAAREAECDTDEKAFEEALKKVAKAPPGKSEKTDEDEPGE